MIYRSNDLRILAIMNLFTVIGLGDEPPSVTPDLASLD
jgi:hypothetical protein